MNLYEAMNDLVQKYLEGKTQMNLDEALNDLVQKYNKTNSFISTTEGMSGHFAVMWHFNTEWNIWEPWDSGFGRYATREEAIIEAKEWAELEELEYRD